MFTLLFFSVEFYPSSGSSKSLSSFNLSSPKGDTDDSDSFDYSSPTSPNNTTDYHDDSVFSPIYSGSSVTFCGAVSAIMNFCTSAKLSYVTIEKSF